MTYLCEHKEKSRLGTGLPDFIFLRSQTLISAVKKTKETKSQYKEKQRALIKVWLIYSCNLATLTRDT